jgi:hypothetical protein
MALELSLKINNQDVIDGGSPIRIVSEFPTLNWSFDLADRVSIDSSSGVISSEGEFAQASYEIRVSNSSTNLGTDSFVGNMAQTGNLLGQESFWRYRGLQISRGTQYYGQVRATDNAGRVTDWGIFTFKYNSLPVISEVLISPSHPSVTDDLILSYNYSDSDSDLESGSKIRWFRNGVYQKKFDDALIIEAFNLQNKDIWNADVYPSDGYEYGARATSSHVLISKTSVTVSDLNILPKNPNIDDILKADFLISDELEQENVLIRWYINDFVNSSFNDQVYVKLPVSVGDSVRFEVKHEESGTYKSSQSVNIGYSDYVIRDIIVDGKSGDATLNVSSTTPLLQWKTFVPEGKTVEYISIKVGTFYEADNIYSSVLDYDGDSFTIPSNIMEKGRDYYVSIAASDTQTFSKYTTSHFRVNGSRWENSVSNSTGWTFEMLFSIPSDSAMDTDYQVIRINDGSKFAEIRIYSSKIVLISSSRIEYNNTTKFGSSVLNVSGRGDNIKIYLNREIIINGTGIFTQISNIKRLEIGSSGNETFVVKYRYFFYTTSGYYLPQESSEYSNIKFHTYMEFEDNEIVSLNGDNSGKYIFGLNSDNDSESSSIYAIVPGASSIKCSTVSRTFSPINRINKSPDNNITAYAHAKGTTVIKGYVINPFNHELIFVGTDGNLNEILPESNGWELIRSTNFTAAYFNADGFNINTLGEI